MEPNQGIKAWQWVVTVIVIIILIILGYYMFKGNKPGMTDTTDTTATVPADINEVNRVVVSDQYPGNVVYITSAQFANPGWVSIHKDSNGGVGPIIGTGYFEKGINPGKIILTEKTVDGGTYYAMLHGDDGDKLFSDTKDLPLKDSKGNVIMKVFKATSSIKEIKG